MPERVKGGMSLADTVRRHDPDRFLTALFAPQDKREMLFTLYAFNHELARAREVVSEPPLALIRLQWWREVVEGATRRHVVAGPLRAAIAEDALLQADLLEMIDAREAEVEPTIATVEEWRAYLSGSAGSVAVAAGRLLGAPEPEELRPAGVAYGIAGLLRSIPAHARQQRCLLPDDVLAAHGLTPERVIAEPGSARPVAAVLARQGIAMLHSMRLPRHAIAAALPAVLARRDLSRLPAIRPQRGLGDRLAVTIAGLACRI